MSKGSLILLSFIVAKFVLQFGLILPEYDLQRDEYLHLDQANHLAWGYLSVPPFTLGSLCSSVGWATLLSPYFFFQL